MTTITTHVQDEQTQPKAWPRPAAFDVLRIVLGLVLLTAAILKGWQLATGPTPEKGLLTSRWFLVVGVEGEWLLSVWLLSGLYKRAVWWAAFGCFTLFASITLYKALSGEASCGCFGKVQINPWYTLAFDMAILGMLLFCSPRERDAGVVGHLSGVTRRGGWPLNILAVGALSAGVPIAIGIGGYKPASLTSAGQIIGETRVVVLEPEKWVGGRFPLLEHIDIGDQLAKGKWVVVLYQHDCSHCQEALSRYEELTRELIEDNSALRLALVELPPFAPTGPALESTGTHKGHLTDRYDWFVQTPTEVVLTDGQVVQANEGVKAAGDSWRYAYGG